VLVIGGAGKKRARRRENRDRIVNNRGGWFGVSDSIIAEKGGGPNLQVFGGSWTFRRRRKRRGKRVLSHFQNSKRGGNPFKTPVLQSGRQVEAGGKSGGRICLA